MAASADSGGHGSCFGRVCDGDALEDTHQIESAAALQTGPQFELQERGTGLTKPWLGPMSQASLNKPARASTACV